MVMHRAVGIGIALEICRKDLRFICRESLDGQRGTERLTSNIIIESTFLGAANYYQTLSSPASS